MSADIVSTIQHLKMADAHMESFIADRPNALLARTFKRCRNRVAACFTDLKSEPKLTDIVIAGINQEVNGDAFSVPAIQEKVPLLPPGKRILAEYVIDLLLKGKDFELHEKKEAEETT